MGPLELITDRLILKVESLENANKILDLYNRNRACFEQYEPTRPRDFYTLEYHQHMLVREIHAYNDGHFVRYYIYKKLNPNMIIGSINLNIHSNSIAEMGYKVDYFFHNQGIAREACLAVINMAFKYYKINQIDARIHPTNSASIKLATNLGFHPVRLEKNAANILGTDQDLIRYSLITSAIQ